MRLHLRRLRDLLVAADFSGFAAQLECLLRPWEIAALLCELCDCPESCLERFDRESQELKPPRGTRKKHQQQQHQRQRRPAVRVEPRVPRYKLHRPPRLSI